MKAVIVDFHGGHAAALRDDGSVIKIRDAGYTLGQVIELHERVRPRWRRTIISLAAAAALLLSIGGAAYATPYGVVTLDADASIQYTINMFDYVLDVQAADEEGEALLKELDIRQLRHRPVDSAITSAMQHLEQRRAPENAELSVSVSANTRNERHTERLSRELERTVNAHMPIPVPESGNQPGMHDRAAQPPHLENPVADASVVYPDDKQAPNAQPDGAGTANVESIPREPSAGQLRNENGESAAAAASEKNPPDMRREERDDTGSDHAGTQQRPMRTEDGAARLLASEGNARKEGEAPVFDGQSPEQSFGGQQPYKMDGGVGDGPSMAGAGPRFFQ